MRHIPLSLILGSLILAAGCNGWRRDQEQVRNIDRAPAPEQLVRYLNANSQRVQGLESQRVFIDVKQGSEGAGLEAILACQKPRDFRLVGRVAGSTEVDMGSNNEEFWYWIKRAPPPAYVYHCSYQDFQRGVRMPFPFQPDWIMEAMGIATYDENKKYEVRETQTTVELIERATSPQGQPVRKVTVFSRGQAATNKPQVTAYVLQDAAGKEIATAQVSEVQWDQASGAVLPKRIHFVWPAEKVEMKMRLDGVRVGTIDAQRAASMFTRRNLSNLPGYDLARGPDSPAGGSATAEPLQRTGGPLR